MLLFVWASIIVIFHILPLGHFVMYWNSLLCWRLWVVVFALRIFILLIMTLIQYLNLNLFLQLNFGFILFFYVVFLILSPC